MSRKNDASARSAFEEHRQEYNRLYKGKIGEKLKKAAPYNFFLTHVKEHPLTQNEDLSISFPEMLDPCLGKLIHTVHVNFMVELGWLLAQHLMAGDTNPSITLLYDQIDSPNEISPRIKHVKITPKSAFGHHHTKMSIFFYDDRSVRFAIYTANLIESDWENRTQGVWLSPKCPYLGDDVPINYGESDTLFKRDMLQYLKSYNKPELKLWIARIQRVDVSEIKVCLVASVPGEVTDMDVGYKKMDVLLNRYGCPEQDDWDLVAQCSSIGSLGDNPNRWLFYKFTPSLKSKGEFKLIYPSERNVEFGYRGSEGCLPYQSSTHTKQEWLNKYLYKWKSDSRYRTRAIPHLKSYAKIDPRGEKLGWFLLTSANLSKAAWGMPWKSGKFNCLSHELGVLFLPYFFTSQGYFNVFKGGRPSTDVGSKSFPVPYDLPLEPYENDDRLYLYDRV
ncbi:UNVERIFIED_CONTAM: hypothetical protein PYX00_005531 [Menopon gallinae]|uniref:Tyrosyl-DNA phosphodiesterase n=1 Tax=Menopon gallinae TaxID=328185 RepID=A0AAW2HTG4_9NEOP